jgi:hypothetical protein
LVQSPVTRVLRARLFPLPASLDRLKGLFFKVSLTRGQPRGIQTYLLHLSRIISRRQIPWQGLFVAKDPGLPGCDPLSYTWGVVEGGVYGEQWTMKRYQSATRAGWL